MITPMLQLVQVMLNKAFCRSALVADDNMDISTEYGFLSFNVGRTIVQHCCRNRVLLLFL